MAFDAFISYASPDKPVADAVCARLEAAGIRCWIAPRDITPGISYGEAIINAIHEARVMILVFSSHANMSGQVPKEVERAVSNNVPIIPFRIENVAPGASLDYFIGSVHWLDAMTPPMEQHIDSLATTVRKLVGAREFAPEPAPGPIPPQPVPPRPVPPQPVPPPPAPMPKTALIVGAVLLAAIVAFGVYKVTSRPSDTPAPPDNASNTQPAPDSHPAPTAPSLDASKHTSPSHANNDPIVGCYTWFNGAPVTIRANGTMTVGPFTAHWAHTGGASYQFTWPAMIIKLSSGGPASNVVTGSNQYGYSLTGTRTGAGVGLPGTWHWSNGWNVNVAQNGTFTSGPWSGTWHSLDMQHGLYEMIWPQPVDTVQLIDAVHINGANQYGVAISGQRSACP